MYGQEQGRYDPFESRPTDLTRFSDLRDWELSEGDPDIRGWKLQDRDGNKIGEIEDLLVDTNNYIIPFAIIGYGGLLGMGQTYTLVPLNLVEVDSDNKRCIFSDSADRVTAAPLYTQDNPRYNEFYDYWSGAQAEGPAMAHEEHEEEHARAEGGERVVEAEERPETEKRTEPVKRTRVRLYRREVESRKVRPGERVLPESETLEIPVAEEHLEVVKRTEMTDEVVIEPETVVEEKEVTAEVRKEHVEAEEPGDVDVEEDDYLGHPT